MARPDDKPKKKVLKLNHINKLFLEGRKKILEVKRKNADDRSKKILK